MDLPKLVKNEITAIDPEASVILYGSRARGDFSEASDWDFLILLNIPVSEKQKREIRDRLFNLELKTDEVISSIIDTKTNWPKYRVTPFFQNVKRDGIEI